LLYCARSDVTIERIRVLVAQVGPEEPTVEYKGVMSQGIAKAVAALAKNVEPPWIPEIVPVPTDFSVALLELSVVERPRGTRPAQQ
jgi:hypothetical protein